MKAFSIARWSIMQYGHFLYQAVKLDIVIHHDYYKYHVMSIFWKVVMGKSTLARLEEILGKPAFNSHGVSLFRIDALEAMSMLPEENFDLGITSPPYNIGKEYETPMPLSSYIEWSEKWIGQAYKLCKPHGALWLNLGYLQVPKRGRAVPISYLLWDRIPFFLLQEIVWNYGAGVSTKRIFSPRNEKFLWLVKSPDNYTFNLDDVRDPNTKYPNQKKNGKIRVNPLGKNPTDVWQFPKVTTGKGLTGQRASPERTKHPAQFPLAVIDRIVKACSNPRDVIFDPFIGSGTTAVAAFRNGRDAVGFEIKPEYIDIAVERVERSIREVELEKMQRKLL